MWRHNELCEQICPLDPLTCSLDVNPSTSQHTSCKVVEDVCNIACVFACLFACYFVSVLFGGFVCVLARLFFGFVLFPFVCSLLFACLIAWGTCEALPLSSRRLEFPSDEREEEEEEEEEEEGVRHRYDLTGNTGERTLGPLHWRRASYRQDTEAVGIDGDPLKTGILEAVLHCAWRYWVSARTGSPGVSIL